MVNWLPRFNQLSRGPNVSSYRAAVQYEGDGRLQGDGKLETGDVTDGMLIADSEEYRGFPPDRLLPLPVSRLRSPGFPDL